LQFVIVLSVPTCLCSCVCVLIACVGVCILGEGIKPINFTLDHYSRFICMPFSWLISPNFKHAAKALTTDVIRDENNLKGHIGCTVVILDNKKTLNTDFVCF